MILLDKGKRAEAKWAARWVTYIETAVEAAFQEEFVAAIDIPHARDAFPHLAPLLAAARAQWTPDREASFTELASGGRNRRASSEERRARRARRSTRSTQ